MTRRRQLHQRRWFVLLLDLSARWIQSNHRALGTARDDEGTRYRIGHCQSDRETSWRFTSYYQRQRPSVHRHPPRRIKEFVRQYGLTHVRTSPYYPQSNGKLERWHGSLKNECIRPSCPATREEAQKRIEKYVNHYNHVRLHSAIGYITPADCLAGLSQVIGEERDRKLESARERRQQRRAAAKQQVA